MYTHMHNHALLPPACPPSATEVLPGTFRLCTGGKLKAVVDKFVSGRQKLIETQRADLSELEAELAAALQGSFLHDMADPKEHDAAIVSSNLCHIYTYRYLNLDIYI